MAYFALAHFCAICYCCFTLSHCRNFSYFSYWAKGKKMPKQKLWPAKSWSLFILPWVWKMWEVGMKTTCTFSFTCRRPRATFPGKRDGKCLDFHYMARKRRKLFTCSPIFLFICGFGVFVLACGSGCRYLYLNAACGSPLRLLLCNESLFANRNSLNRDFELLSGLPVQTIFITYPSCGFMCL